MLSDKEKNILISIAKETIKAHLHNEQEPDFYYGQEALNQEVGAFVTLKITGQLRGCIGMLSSKDPLYKTISHMALQAAFHDPRFEPLKIEEYDAIEVEISVLSAFKKIHAIDEIEVGKHGLMINRGYNSGLLLPQVADEYKWDKKTFLEQTCLKAGLNVNAWKDDESEISIFSAEVFNSKEVKK
jgi:AmmeMemoRadiSam system protein A